ncbi:hypothetical protein LCGC14_1077710, partial [marine sediment metagenome]
MKKITIDQIHGWGACNRGPHQKYGKPALVKLFGGNSITPLALSRLRIPIADRFWVLLHEGVLSRKNLRLFMADCAEHVLHIFEKRRPKDDRPRKAIQGARDFAEDRINFKESTNPAHTSWKINLKRFAKPIAAAAVIVLAITIFFNASVAEAIDLDQVYKALRRAKNVHVSTYTPDNSIPISERWVSRESNLMLFKRSDEWVLWDVGEKLMRSRSVSQQTVKTTTIQKDALTKIEKIIAAPVGLSPFDNTSGISVNAKWHKLSDLPDSTLSEGIAAYDLIWVSKSSHGDPVYNKWRCFIESDTKLPKKIEAWEKMADEEYKLATTAEFD